MKIVIIGSGNVATHLSQALAIKNSVIQVYSKNIGNALALAKLLPEANATDKLDEIEKTGDVYILSIKDDAIEPIINELKDTNPNALWLHTSGSKPMNVFKDKMINYGVFYPLQTFSKNVELDISKVPFFIEGNSEYNTLRIKDLAMQLSSNVYEADSDMRGKMHIAAVFACNFTNHLWSLSEEVLKDANIPFSVLIPLIEASVDKIKKVSPTDAQTGPAVRGDIEIINNHLRSLNGNKKEIYELLSKSILNNKI